MLEFACSSTTDGFGLSSSSGGSGSTLPNSFASGDRRECYKFFQLVTFASSRSSYLNS